MSTVKAVNFQHPSSTAANLTLAADGTVTGGLPAGGRNLLYNGAMQVAQRGTSTASITTGGYYTADRWKIAPINLGTWTNSIESDGPLASGLSKSLKMLCTTADSSPAAADECFVQQIMEGQDLQRIAKGTASAQQLTLSFWVKSNATGTYTILLYDDDNTRAVSASYSISASATWERKTITFPGDTTGSITNDNSSGMTLRFYLAAGSNFTSGTLGTTWASYTAANTAVGQTNLAAATNNYWQVTGVQLETGSVATAFEFKSFGQELRECQRYYWRINAGTASTYTSFGQGYCTSATNAYCSIDNPVPLRVPATAVDASGLAIQDSGGGVVAITGAAVDQATIKNSSLGMTVASGLTTHRPARLLANNNTTAYLGISAEL